MNDQKNSLFSAYNMNGLNLRNRVVMAPMTRNLSPNGIPKEYAPTYYARRAQGGVGLILTEGVEVSHRAASGYPNCPNLETDEAKKMWQKVVSEVHKNNSSIFCQLWHVGGIRKAGMPPIPEIPGFTPSGYVVPGKKVAHEMTYEEIKELIEVYAEDAKICEEIGFDGVERHWKLNKCTVLGDDTRPRSNLHLTARKLLKELFPYDTILEEVPLPGSNKPSRPSKLFADFFVPAYNLIVEVHGRQHFEFVSFFL